MQSFKGLQLTTICLFLVSFAVIVGCGGSNTVGVYQEGFLHIISGRASSGGNTVTPFSVDPEAGTLTQLSAELMPVWTNGSPQILDVDSLGDGNILLLERNGREFMSVIVDLDSGLVSEAGNRQTISFANMPSQLHYDNGIIIINEAGGAAAPNELAVYLFDPIARTITEAAGSPLDIGTIHASSGFFIDGHFFICTDANVIGIGDPIGLRHYTVSAAGQLTQVGQVDLDTTDANAISGIRFCYEGNLLIVVVYYFAQAPSVNLVQIDGAGALTRLSSLTLNAAGRLGGDILKVGDRYLIGEQMASSQIHVIENNNGTLAEATGFPFTLAGIDNLYLDDTYGDYIYFRMKSGAVNWPSFRSMAVATATLNLVEEIDIMAWADMPASARRQGKLFALSMGGGSPNSAAVIRVDLSNGDLTFVGEYGLPGTGPYTATFTLKP